MGLFYVNKMRVEGGFHKKTRPLLYIWTLEHFLYLCKAKEFYACISHPMMGVANTGTGAKGFFSFFIYPLHISAK
jgi:hypothetical protein